MKDFLPRNDADFDIWQSVFVKYVTENAEKWNISSRAITALTENQTSWAADFEVTRNKGDRSAADVQRKNESRSRFEKAIRAFNLEFVAHNSLVNDADRVKMNLTVPSGTRNPTPVPATRPMGNIDASISLVHRILFFDSESAHSNAKPEGVHGCEMYLKIDGEQPLNSEGMIYLGTCTSSPLTVTHTADKAGKKAWYLLRWVNSRGEAGPWSVAISAMILG